MYTTSAKKATFIDRTSILGQAIKLLLREAISRPHLQNAIEVIDFKGGPADLPFQAWKREGYSQFGEEGIIETLIRMTKMDPRYFVEFGAWDGTHFSNCARLAEGGWNGCFIESDETRFKELENKYAAQAGIAKLNAYVSSSGAGNLDSLLQGVNAPKDFGVLSIDIDGNDFHVWKALKNFSPALCVVEFNPTIPANVIYVQEDNPDIQRGASLAALNKLAEAKGYSLVAATVVNAFFLKNEFCNDFAIPVYTPQQVKDTTYEAAIFHGYDGTMFVAGHRNLLWHNVPFDATELQVLPSEMRRPPVGQTDEHYAMLQKFREKRSGS